MNVPTRVALDRMLAVMGADSTQLGNASLGLISAPFSPSAGTTLASLTEANFHGYVRKSIGNPTVPFTGGDGLEYVEGTTVQWLPSDTVSPNTIYGAFLTTGSGTVTLVYTDAFPAPLPMSGPANQITITPRFGANPAGNWGLEVVSN